MSRLRELIDELCPDGVEYKTLGSLGQFFGGLSGKTKADFGEGYPFVTYMNVFNNAKVKPEMVDRVRIVSGERQNMLHLGDVLFTVSSETPDECGMSSVVTFEPDGPLFLNSFCTGWRPNDSRLVPDYLAYVLRSWELRKQISKTANGVIRFNVSKPLLADVKVPVPPIEVQREVVRILDSFQELDDALTAEIEAREKQLAWYRAKVYTSTAYPMKELGSIGTFERGRRFTRAEMGGNKTPCIHYGDIYTKCDFFSEEPLDRLMAEKPNLRYAHRGDVVIAATSENAEDVCKAIVWLGDEDAAVHDDCLILHHEQNPYYLSFFFNSEPFMSEKMRFVTESKVVRISGNEMAQIVLPIPPVDVQNDIAEALLTFVRHTKAIVAERDARRKQFEHYRDKLLSFPKKEA